jgi:nucleotide-binding universal stress UspA family protein
MPTATPAPTPSYRHLLVPLDGSALSAGALPTARALAARFGADVHTISVTSTAADAAESTAQGRRLLGADSTYARVHVQIGNDPAVAIREQAEALGSCLVCMATHGRSHVPDALVGSVTRSVLASSRAPVVTVGPLCALRDPDHRVPSLSGDVVLACVDGSEASELVLPVAAAWAERLALRLTIVTVAEPSPPPLRADATWHRHHGPQTNAEEYLRHLGDQWTGTVASVQTEVIYDPISPSEGIRDYLADHSVALVAATTHARTGMSGFMVGSTAAAIAHASTVPVLMVPSPGARR